MFELRWRTALTVELTVDVLRLHFVQRTIWKRRLNSEQIDVISMEFFSSKTLLSGHSGGTDVRRLYSQAM